ncbi:MAG TPA: flagellar hook-associated protein FlgK [Solirubrobacteraceae bacterium]|nr:flagellar hook-associated protein FlgK [Solirubrobacteraceae bacterium]
MAIPTFTGLETALRGLTAAQAAIDTTGQNIANANNPGYSRQTAVLAESDSLDLPAFSNTTGHGVQLGTGVDVTTINRVRDQFLDVQYRAQNSATSGLQTASGLLQQVQTALAEPSTDGVTSQLTAFWNSWSNLANAPTSLAAKQGVVDSATTLADTFNGIDSQLQTIQNQADSQYTSLTSSSGQIQSDANQIAALNGEINQALGAGQSPNNLLDQRDQLLDDLSQYGTVSVTDPGNGLLVVNFGGDMSTPLVNGKSANSVSSLNLGPNSGGTIGTLAGLVSPTGQISGYLNTLNQFATTLANSVNALHTATPFFAVNTSTTSLGATATTLSVAVAPANVQTTTTSNPGANDVAMAIAGLAGGAADQDYSSFVSQVGSDVQSNQSNLTTANTLLSSINGQRESVSGVSLDEEMTNLITYQRAYEASARMMNTINSTLDTIINQVGAGL